MALNISIDASGAQEGAREFEQATTAIGQSAGTAASKVNEIMDSFKRLQQVQQNSSTSAFQQLSVLRQQIAIQEQARAGALSYAEAERKIGEAAIYAQTGNRQLSQQLAAARQEFQQNVRAMQEMENTTKRVATESSNLSGILGGLISAYAAYRAAQAAVNQVQGGVQANASLEGSQLAIAALLQGTTQLKDSFGNVVNATTAWTANLKEAKNIQGQIAEISAATLGTDEELLQVFRTVLAFSRGQKGDLEDRLKLAQGITNLGKLEGLQGERLAEETRQLLTLESQRGQDTLAVLGISFKQAQQYKEQGTLLEHLLEPLAAYNALAKTAETSWEGLTTSVETFARLFRADTFSGTFNALKQVIQGMADEFNTLRKDGGLGAAVSVSDEQLQKFGKTIADMYALVQTIIASIANVVISIGASFNDATDGAKSFHSLLVALADSSRTLGSELAVVSQKLKEAVQYIDSLGGKGAVLGTLLGGIGGFVAGGPAGLLTGGAAGLAIGLQFDALIKKGQELEAEQKRVNALISEFGSLANEQSKGIAAPAAQLDALKNILLEVSEKGIILSKANKDIVDSFGLLGGAVTAADLKFVGMKDDAEAMGKFFAQLPVPLAAVSNALSRSSAEIAKATDDIDKAISAATKQTDAIEKSLAESFAKATGNFTSFDAAVQKQIADERKAAEEAFKRQTQRADIPDALKTQLDTLDTRKQQQENQKKLDDFIAFEKKKTSTAQTEAEARNAIRLAEAEAATSATKSQASQLQAEIAAMEGLVGKDDEIIAKTQQLSQVQTQEHLQRIAELNIKRASLQDEIAQEEKLIQAIQNKQSVESQKLTTTTDTPGREAIQTGITKLTAELDDARQKLQKFQADAKKINSEIATESVAATTQQIENTKKLQAVEQQRFEARVKQEEALRQNVEAIQEAQQAQANQNVSGVEDRIKLEQAEIDLLKAKGASYKDIEVREKNLIALEKQLAELNVQTAQTALDKAKEELDIAQKRIASIAEQIAQQGETTALNDQFNESLRETEKLTAKVTDAQTALDRARAQSAADGLKAQQKVIDLQKEEAKNALLSTGTIRNFFSDFIRGIAEGNQNLGKLLTDFAQSISAKFFQQLLVGKDENFDQAIIGNVSELFGFGKGGILGSIMKDGGANLFSQLASGFTDQAAVGSKMPWDEILPNVFSGGSGSAGNPNDVVTNGGAGFPAGGTAPVDASKVVWEQAGQSAALTYFKQFSTTAAVAYFGSQVASMLAKFFGGSQQAQLGAQVGEFLLGPIGGLLGGLIGQFFFTPGRIQLEKEAIQKNFEEVFKGVKFDVLKEPDVAAGLDGFKELEKAALSLGAVYAHTLGGDATQGSITRFAGQFLGNLKQMGDSSDEAKKKLTELAQAMKADLGTAIEDINGLTTQFSDHQKNNLLSIEQFEKRLADARKNLAQYGDTASLTAKQLSELALAHGNTGSFIATYGDLITGAIQLNTDFKDSAIITAGVNNLLADKFLAVAKAQDVMNTQTQELADKLRAGNLSLEEAVIAFNKIEVAAGKAGLELKDFTLDPTKIKQFADLLKSLTFDSDNFSKGLGDALSQGLANGLDPSKYGETFDNFFNQLIRENIIKSIVAGFTQGLSLETLQPLFSGVTALLVEVGTGKLSLADFGSKLNDLLAASKDQVNGIRDAFIAAGQAGKTLLDAFTGITTGGQPDFSGFTSGLTSALQDGLSNGLDPSKYKDAFNDFFNSFLRTTITKAIVEGFAKGLALDALKPFFDKFSELLKGIADNSLSTGEFATKFDDLLRENGPAFEKIKVALEQAGQAGYALLRALGLLPNTVDQTLAKIDELKNKLEEIAQKRIDIQINLQERLASIGVEGADAKAFALRQQNLNDQIAKIKADPIITGQIAPKDDTEFQKANAQIEKALATIDTLSQGVVQNFEKQKSLIESSYQAQVTAIQKTGQAEQDAIKAQFEGQKAASQSRIDALNNEKTKIQEAYQARIDAISAEIEAAQKQLQIAQEFQRVGEQIRDTIIKLTASTQAPIAPPGQLAFLQRQAADLRSQLASAPEEKKPDLINRLSDILQQELSTNVFQRPSTEYKDQFNAIVLELEKLRDLSLRTGSDADSLQQKILSLQEEQKALQQEQTDVLKGIDAQIKAEQDLQKQLADQEQAALKAQAEAQQAAIDAARKDADRQIEAARADAAKQLEDLYKLQQDLLDKQEALVQGRLTVEQQIEENTRRTADTLDRIAGNTQILNGVPTDSTGHVVTTGGSHVTRDSSGHITGPAPSSGPPAYPTGWNPDTQPGQKWTGDHWMFVNSGADVTWDAGTNTAYLHGQPLTDAQFQNLAKNGLPPTSARQSAGITEPLSYYPPGQAPTPLPPDVYGPGTIPGGSNGGVVYDNGPIPRSPTAPGTSVPTAPGPKQKGPGWQPWGNALSTSVNNSFAFNVTANVTGNVTAQDGKAFGTAAGQSMALEFDRYLSSPAATAKMTAVATEVARREVNR